MLRTREGGGGGGGGGLDTTCSDLVGQGSRELHDTLDLLGELGLQLIYLLLQLLPACTSDPGRMTQSSSSSVRLPQTASCLTWTCYK